MKKRERRLYLEKTLLTFRELMQRVEKIEEMNRKAGVYINI